MNSLGGYRLVRRLGAGRRSEVWLGSDGAETVAIKVFREETSQESIDAEIEALGRASGRHFVRLDDLAMGSDGRPCLILQRLSQWNLGRVLATSRPCDGEAVTILAPLCSALSELHRVGVAHGCVRGSSVLFDLSGAPVLTSFGHVSLFGAMPDRQDGLSVPPGQLRNQAEVAEDLDGLRELCRATLRADSDVLRWLAETTIRDDSTFAGELAERLFHHAAPKPVRFSAPNVREDTSLIPSRMVSTRVRGEVGSTSPEHAREPEPHASSGSGVTTRDAVALLHLPEGMKKSLSEWLNNATNTGPVGMASQRIKDALRPVRKPVWIVAAIVAVCVVVVTALLPPSSHDGAAADESKAAGRSESSGAPAASATAWRAEASPAVVTGDDPLAAAAALLDARTACFEQLSVLCLDSVNQQGSAVMQADAAQVRLLQQGGAVDGSRFVAPVLESTARDFVVQERLGDSVLLVVTFGEHEASTESLSLLLIKRDEGWRIRDLTPLSSSQ